MKPERLESRRLFAGVLVQVGRAHLSTLSGYVLDSGTPLGLPTLTPNTTPSLVSFGQTANFMVSYDSSLTNGPALAQAVLTSCEPDMSRLSALFGGITLPKSTLPIQIDLVTGPGGASNNTVNQITCYCNSNTLPAHLPALVACEESEIFMTVQAKGWNPSYSNGEALSRVCAQILYPAYAWLWSTGQSWLDGSSSNPARSDWVDYTFHSDRDFVSIGCGSLFLNYLAHQLNFNWSSIIQAGAPSTGTLAETASILGVSNAWQNFSSLIAKYVPPGSSLPSQEISPGVTEPTDDPFPLPSAPPPTGALVFAVQPSDTTAGTLAPITVDVDDSSGVLASSDNSHVTLALAGGSSGATLGGTTSVAAVNGVATFGNLSITTPGESYTLTATDGALTPAASTPFNITVAAPAASNIRLSSSPNPAAAGTPVTLVAIVSAAAGGGPTPTGTVTFLDGGSEIGARALDASGQTSITLSTLPMGTDVIAASYSGDGNYSTSASSPATQTILSTSSIQPSNVLPTIGNAVFSSSALAGGPFVAKVPVGVRNTGPTVSGTFRVNLFADQGVDGLDGQQVLLGSFTKRTSLKFGKAFMAKFSVHALPSSLAQGTYFLYAQIVDPLGDTSLDWTTRTFSVAPADVRLQAGAGPVSPSTLRANSSGAVPVFVTNEGNVNATGALSIVVDPSTDGVNRIDDPLGSGDFRVNLKPGKEAKLKVRIKPDSSFSAGTYDTFITATLNGVSTTAVGPEFTFS